MWMRRVSRGLFDVPSSCVDVSGTSGSGFAWGSGFADGSEGGGVAGWPLVAMFAGLCRAVRWNRIQCQVQRKICSGSIWFRDRGRRN